MQLSHLSRERATQRDQHKHILTKQAPSPLWTTRALTPCTMQQLALADVSAGSRLPRPDGSRTWPGSWSPEILLAQLATSSLGVDINDRLAPPWSAAMHDEP